MKKRKSLIYLLLSLSMIIWGSSYIFLEILYKYFSPLTTASLRVIIAAIFLLALSFLAKKYQKIDKKDIWMFVLFALIDPFLYFVCESYGLLYSNPVIAAVIIATIPLLTPIAAVILIKEKLTLLNFAGIILSFTGVIFVIITPEFKLSIKLTGLILLFCAVLCAVSYNFFMKKLTDKYNIYTIITTQNIFSTIYFIPLLIIFGWKELVQTKYNMDIIINLLCLSLFASALAFIFYANAIKKIGITRANVFTNMIPVFTAVLAFFLLKQSITVNQITGILLVVIGLFLSQLEKKHYNLKNFYLREKKQI